MIFTRDAAKFRRELIINSIMRAIALEMPYKGYWWKTAKVDNRIGLGARLWLRWQTLWGWELAYIEPAMTWGDHCWLIVRKPATNINT